MTATTNLASCVILFILIVGGCEIHAESSSLEDSNSHGKDSRSKEISFSKEDSSIEVDQSSQDISSYEVDQLSQEISRSSENGDGSLESASSQENSSGNEDISLLEHSRESRESSSKENRNVWTLSEPILTIKSGRVHVSLKGSKKLKWIKFYMSINKTFNKFNDAEFKVKLKCNKNKMCQKRVGPAIREGDTIYYGMLAKVKKQNGQMKLCCRSWTPLPVTTTATPVASVSCSAFSEGVPNGCKEILYAVNNSFVNPGTGRGNPERGFYRYTESKTSSWTPVSNYPLADWVNSGYTLIYRIYVLDTFVDLDISNDILEKIRQDFDDVKSAGLKVLLRFSYSIDINVIDDAKPDQLKKHLVQLTPIFQDYTGIIALVQTGFIGVWGEWYYTANYGNEGVISEADYENRRQVVFSLLDALPTSRQIELRTPNYKMNILERQSAITSDEAHTDVKVARIGHHNDCFLASDADFGTYTDKEKEYPYLQNETLYVCQGGETCNPNSPRSDCPTAVKELSELHFTYLNSQYHPDVLQSWQDQGCYAQVDVSLGYRLVAESALLPSSVSRGSQTIVGLKINNIGWAAPINYRSAKLVMIHKSSEEEHVSALQDDLDLRYWLPGQHQFDLTLAVPESASTGEYEVFLEFPDGDASLKDLDVYNIVMENTEYEDNLEKRLNLLGEVTVV